VSERGKGKTQVMSAQTRKGIARQQQLHAWGVVYFVLAESVRLVKIGTATNLDKRMQSLAAMSPVPVTELGWIRGYVNVERWCQFHCIRDRAHHEWFHWTPRVASFIDLVLRHGELAAQSLCPLELVADGPDMYGQPYDGRLGVLPGPNMRSTTHVATEVAKLTPIGHCPCVLCAKHAGED
jgi:hypothetical protein